MPTLAVLQDGGNSAGSGDVFSQVLGSSSENLLADDSERLAEALVSCGEQGGQRVDIIVDNAGSFAWGCDDGGSGGGGGGVGSSCCRRVILITLAFVVVSLVFAVLAHGIIPSTCSCFCTSHST